jgi:hypothetical protein
MTLSFKNRMVILAIVAGVTAAVIWAFPAWSEPGAAGKAGNAVSAIPLSKLSMTRDRPIFSPSRRPPSPPAQQVIAKPMELPKPVEKEQQPPLILVGTVAGEGSGIAVFVEQATENAIKLRVNESYKGWTLHSIQGREVTLQNDRKSSVLALAPPGGSVEPASAQAALVPPKRLPRR